LGPGKGVVPHIRAQSKKSSTGQRGFSETGLRFSRAIFTLVEAPGPRA
jgi:hypothetical protein